MRFVSCQLSVVSCQLAAKIVRAAQRTTDHGQRTTRSGMTLVELLVVIVILTTIVGAAIPLMSPSNDDRRLREAARGLNTFITGAQAKAIALNRPCGIALKRLSQDTNTDPNKNSIPAKDIHPDNGVSLEVFYVEQLPPYAGFDANSRASVSLHPTRPGYAVVRFVARTSDTTLTATLPTGWAPDLFPSSTIRPGDVIEIAGTRFELLNDNDLLATVTVDSYGYYSMSSGPSGGGGIARIIAKPVNDSGQQIVPRYDRDGNEIGAKAPPVPAPYWTFPSPYKVLRQPTPTSDEPYQLPEGTAIDLRASGVGSGDFFYWPGVRDNSKNVIIMFAPEGRVSRVAFSQLPVDAIETSDVFDKSVVDNVYLLIGRRENVPAPDATSPTADPSLNTTEWAKLATDDDRAKRRLPLNWLGGSSRWVVIGSQSGRIATIENAFVDPVAVMTSPQAPFTSASQSSEFMRAAQILAAREFTREMAQLGGR